MKKPKGNQDPRRALAILTDMAVPGASVSAVAKRHHVSVRTVYRIIRSSCSDPRPSPPKVDKVAAAIIRQADVHLSSWVDLCEPAIREGIEFLQQSIRTLKPEKLADARFVSECIVGTLSNVATAWRRLEIQLQESAAKAKPTATQDNTSLTNLPDDDLIAEAARISSSEVN